MAQEDDQATKDELARQVGPIPVMLQEHEMGRALVNVLDELAQHPMADASLPIRRRPGLT